MQLRAGAYELGKRGAVRFDWRDPYHVAVGLTWPRFLALLVALDLAVNAGFATLYWAVPGCLENARPGSFGDAFFFSMETLATVGYGRMAPLTTYGHVVSATEIVTGMMFTALATGLTFVRFSRPRAKILYADQAVVTRHNGRPTLMIRIANGRTSLLVDGVARFYALIAERSAEGQFYRRIHELPLMRARIPIFGLTWTLMHVLDEASPLAGYDPARLRAEEVRLFLAVTARDPTLAAEVHDMHDYGADDVVFGMRYADAVSVDATGRTVADLERVGDIEPE
ncbi:MAG TPA: ion channel [Acetobacteraceae bacterium]|nr:ion channel [Acetobacteraceae bacterium]